MANPLPLKTGEEVSRNIPGARIETQVVVHGNQTQAGRDLNLGRDSYHFDTGAHYSQHIHIHPSIQGQYICLVDFLQFAIWLWLYLMIGISHPHNRSGKYVP